MLNPWALTNSQTKNGGIIHARARTEEKVRGGEIEKVHSPPSEQSDGRCHYHNAYHRWWVRTH